MRINPIVSWGTKLDVEIKNKEIYYVLYDTARSLVYVLITKVMGYNLFFEKLSLKVRLFYV